MQTMLNIKDMSALYSRVFLQILDSSIAEDFTTRHIFEDFLKLADHKSGIVDMTREALSRRLNVPLEILNDAITKLESPDAKSRDPEHEGRRIVRLDNHRDWGWMILNWAKYQEIKSKADAAMRVQKHRDSQKTSIMFTRPSVEEIKLQCAKIGLPEIEAEKFFNYYESNGWRVGKNPMRQWRSALANWRSHWEERGGRLEIKTNNGNHSKPPGMEYYLRDSKGQPVRVFFTHENPPKPNQFGGTIPESVMRSFEDWCRENAKRV